jgi:hypothetical protein
MFATEHFKNNFFFDLNINPEQAKNQIAALYEQSVYTKIQVEGSKED